MALGKLCKKPRQDVTSQESAVVFLCLLYYSVLLCAYGDEPLMAWWPFCDKPSSQDRLLTQLSHHCFFSALFMCGEELLITNLTITFMKALTSEYEILFVTPDFMINAVYAISLF